MNAYMADSNGLSKHKLYAVTVVYVRVVLEVSNSSVIIWFIVICNWILQYIHSL